MDSRFARAKTAYGLTSNVFVTRETADDPVVVGGVGTGGNRWTRTLTPQAAHHLWSHLTCLLFPDKATRVLGLARTAPLNLPVPLLTSRFEIVRNPESCIFDILGWVGDEAWWCRLDEQIARDLWAALDILLFPAGWVGPVTRYGKGTPDAQTPG